MRKKDRHRTLLRLINEAPIHSQAELVNRLTVAGFSVTQASVSRDLEELGVIKRDGRYERAGVPKDTGGFGPVTFEVAGDNLIVCRCSAGLASAITVRIDAARVDGIVGTIAGDDTIFVAVRNGEVQGRIIDGLAALVG